MFNFKRDICIKKYAEMTDAEYGERLFQQKDAEMAKKHAERLFLFVKERVRG